MSIRITTGGINQSTDVVEKRHEVLLIEDEQAISDMLKVSLESENCNVHQAFDDKSAAEILLKVTPDLILLDLLLPGSDGNALLRKFRREEKYRHLPIIVITNLSDGLALENAVADGTSEYLVKAHHTPMEIAKTVRKVMDWK